MKPYTETQDTLNYPDDWNYTLLMHLTELSQLSEYFGTKQTYT